MGVGIKTININTSETQKQWSACQDKPCQVIKEKYLDITAILDRIWSSEFGQVGYPTSGVDQTGDPERPRSSLHLQVNPMIQLTVQMQTDHPENQREEFTCLTTN